MRSSHFVRLALASVLLGLPLLLACAAEPVSRFAGPRLRFHLERTYVGVRLPWRAAWSPDGEHFVLTGYLRFGIASVHDTAARLDEWYQHDLVHPAWSPRGDVLAFSVRQNPRSERYDDFLVGTDGSRRLVAEASPFHTLFWLDDGTLCRRDMQDGRVGRLLSSTVHARPDGRRWPVIVGDVLETSANLGAPSLLVVPEDDARAASHPDSVLLGHAIHAFAKSRAWSFRTRDPESGIIVANRIGYASRQVLLDSAGTSLRSKKQTGRPRDLRWCCIASDGRTILGVDEGADGILPAQMRLRAEALDGRWQTVVEGAPGCNDVAASPRDGWVLLEDAYQEIVHLGRIERVKP